MPPVGGYDTAGHLRALPRIVVIRLRNRNIELVVKTVLQTLEDTSFLFERPAAAHVQLPDLQANDH